MIARSLVGLSLLPSMALAQIQPPVPLPTNPMIPFSGSGSPDRDYMLALIQELHVLINERDRQYAQRFQADEHAAAAAIESVKQAISTAFESSKQAVDKAQAANDKHFDSVNEFRNTLKDQTGTFIPRAEFAAVNKALEEKLKTIEDRVTAVSATQLQNAGKSEGANALWVVLAGAINLLILVAMLAWNMRSRRPAGEM